jgi:hypothetical protein
MSRPAFDHGDMVEVQTQPHMVCPACGHFAVKHVLTGPIGEGCQNLVADGPVSNHSIKTRECGCLLTQGAIKRANAAP